MFMPPQVRGWRGFVLVWVLVWSIVTLGVDGVLIWTFAQQVRAARFPATEGTITRCEVRTTPDGEDVTHQLDVAYEYEVGGKRYTGTRYSYDEVVTNTSAWHTVRDKLPVGSRVPVTYNPADPAASVLHPGPSGFGLAMLWLLTPFNVFMVAGWLHRGRRVGFDPTNPRTVIPTSNGWRVRLFDPGRVGPFARTLFAITFFGVFVWGLGFGFNPPVWTAAVSYLGAVVIAVLVAVRHTPPWLEVDELNRVLHLLSGSASVEIPFGAIRSVVVSHKGTDDADGALSHKYHCDLVRGAPDEPPIRLITYEDREGADAFVAWLRERVGMAPSSGAEAHE
jgi:hypothetical protein